MLSPSIENLLENLVQFHLLEPSSGKHLLLSQMGHGSDRHWDLPCANSAWRVICEPDLLTLKRIKRIYERCQQQFITLDTADAASRNLGDLIAADSFPLDVTSFERWSGCRLRVTLGFDLIRGKVTKVALTDDFKEVPPGIGELLSPGQTAVMDRYFVMDRSYQCYRNFDRWQDLGRHFVCRIKPAAKKKVLYENTLPKTSQIVYDAVVLLGSEGVNRTRKEVRVVGYREKGRLHWIATDRFDLTAEGVRQVFQQRTSVESFIDWWGHYHGAYAQVGRNRRGLLLQIYSGLLSYLLLARYCQIEYGDRLSGQRLHELCNRIRYEAESGVPNPAGLGTLKAIMRPLRQFSCQQGRMNGVPLARRKLNGLMTLPEIGENQVSRSE